MVTDETNAADGSTSGLWVIGAHETLVMNTTSVDDDAGVRFHVGQCGDAGDRPGAAGKPTRTDTFNGQTMPALTGSIAPGSPNVLPGWDAPIENFQAGDLIVLRGLTYGSATASGDVVTVWSGAAGTGSALGSLTFLTKSGAPSTAEAALAATQINSLACFAAGTRIATPDGWVKVEDLRVGDRVGPSRPPHVYRRSSDDRDDGVTARCPNPSSGSARARWIARSHPRPETVWPVRVSAGAFGENIPSRELYLSPGSRGIRERRAGAGEIADQRHHASRRQQRNRVTYYHVELPEHAVILAEGLPVESYLDTGDRTNFNGGETIRLHPEFAVPAAQIWETRGAAALVTSGPLLTEARRRVAGTTRRMPGRSAG